MSARRIRFSQPSQDELVLFFWLHPQLLVLPFPSPEPRREGKGRLCCAWLGLHAERQGKARLRTAGEAEAAEPSTHNEAGSEGGGGETVAASLGAWEQEWWEQEGRDKREAGRGGHRL